jgi:hypothetical protein
VQSVIIQGSGNTVGDINIRDSFNTSSGSAAASELAGQDRASLGEASESPSSESPAARNATDADLDACIEALAADEPDGKVARDTVRKKGPGWLLKQRHVRATADALESRYQEDVHKGRRRGRGEHRPVG